MGCGHQAEQDRGLTGCVLWSVSLEHDDSAEDDSDDDDGTTPESGLSVPLSDFHALQVSLVAWMSSTRENRLKTDFARYGPRTCKVGTL